MLNERLLYVLYIHYYFSENLLFWLSFGGIHWC